MSNDGRADLNKDQNNIHIFSYKHSQYYNAFVKTISVFSSYLNKYQVGLIKMQNFN